jgi:hypothetical protein
MRRALSILSVLLAMSLMVLPAVLADPGGGPSASGVGRASMDLSGRAGTNGYLTSSGLAWSDAVVQRGLRNYAGPNCPGPGWNCTSTGAPVVQIATGNDPRNVFVCDPEDPSSDPDSNMCVISQTNTTGTNEAVCIEEDEQPDGTIEQSCVITQDNDSGANIAIVKQSVKMDSKQTTQRSEQRSQITQTNNSGDNRADVDQRSQLSAKAQHESDISQVQDVIQNSDIDQQTGFGLPPATEAGDNTANVFQSHRLEAKAHKADFVEQLQNAEQPFGETSCEPSFLYHSPNICSTVEQLSTNGELLINLKQELRHDAKAEPVRDDVFQQQGSSEDTGGMVGINHQDSTGVANRFKVQGERQDAKAHAIGGSVTQLQYTGQGPRLNSDQLGNEDNFAMGDQTVNQNASDPTFQQLQIGAIAAPISGNAMFSQKGCQNGVCEEQSPSGGPPGLFAELGCSQGVPPDSEGSPPPEGCVESSGPAEGGGGDG